jgi:hypothetical protein
VICALTRFFLSVLMTGLLSVRAAAAGDIGTQTLAELIQCHCAQVFSASRPHGYGLIFNLPPTGNQQVGDTL